LDRDAGARPSKAGSVGAGGHLAGGDRRRDCRRPPFRRPPGDHVERKFRRTSPEASRRPARRSRGPPMTAPRTDPASDSMLLFEPARRLDPGVNQHAVRIAERLRAIGIAGVREVVTTLRSVAVFFAPLRTRFDELMTRFEQEAARDDSAPEQEQTPL